MKFIAIFSSVPPSSHYQRHFTFKVSYVNMLGFCFPARRFRSSDDVEGSDQVSPGTFGQAAPAIAKRSEKLGLHRDPP